MAKLHAVIMAGGSGTRFWPESRVCRPKQFLPITGGRPMLAETVERLGDLVPPERTWVVTNSRQADGAREACPELREDRILIEPCGRNTAACIGLAATVLAAENPQAVMAVLPADHAIAPAEAFQRTLQAGAEVAAEPGCLVTFGIPPARPATGYGYIHRGRKLAAVGGITCYEVESFTEKPDRPTAERYRAEGTWFWNSGIFLWRADTILAAIRKALPDLSRGLEALGLAARDGSWQTPLFTAELERIYPKLPSISIDHGVMEAAEGVRMLETPFRWSDVGSWQALFEEIGPDGAGNASVFPEGGLLLAEDSSGILAYSGTAGTIAVLGLQDVVVVRTADAVLVARRDRAEEVKALVERLRAMGREDLL